MKKKGGSNLPAVPDPAFDADLTRPIPPPLPDRLAAVAREADAAKAAAAVPGRGPGRPRKDAPLPVAAAPLEDGPFTVSGCESILFIVMEMLSRWANAPQLKDKERVREGAKLHAEVLNKHAPEPWKENAGAFMLGAWWTGVALDIAASKILKTPAPAKEPVPTPPPTPEPVRPARPDVSVLSKSGPK